MALLLFDIDGTLLAPRGLGRHAFEKAVRARYGRLPETSFAFDGLMDTAIARETLRLLGVPPEDHAVHSLLGSYAELLPEERPADPQGHLCPGVPEILDDARRRGHHLGLLTGNLAQTAQTKLQFVDLQHHFPTGAFAGDGAERADLVPVALARCEEVHGRAFSPEETWVIGDSIHDIRAAKQAGVFVAAVATGNTPAALLAAERPHLLLEDLSQAQRLWEAVEHLG